MKSGKIQSQNDLVFRKRLLVSRVFGGLWRICLLALAILTMGIAIKTLQDIPVEQAIQQRMKQDGLKGHGWVDHHSILHMDVDLFTLLIILGFPVQLLLITLQISANRRLAMTHSSGSLSPAIRTLNHCSKRQITAVSVDISIGLQEIKHDDGHLLPEPDRQQLRRILYNYSRKGKKAVASAEFVLSIIQALSELDDIASLTAIESVRNSTTDAKIQAAATRAIEYLTSCNVSDTLLRGSFQDSGVELVRGSQGSVVSELEELQVSKLPL